MPEGNAQPSAARLIWQVLTHLTAIVRAEIALTKAEARQAVALIAGAIALIVVAVVLAVAGLNALVGAAIVGLVQAGMTELGAALTVGVVLLILAVIIFLLARARLHAVTLAPKKVAASLRRDAAAVKGDTTDV